MFRHCQPLTDGNVQIIYLDWRQMTRSYCRTIGVILWRTGIVQVKRSFFLRLTAGRLPFTDRLLLVIFLFACKRPQPSPFPSAFRLFSVCGPSGLPLAPFRTPLRSLAQAPRVQAGAAVLLLLVHHNEPLVNTYVLECYHVWLFY